MTVFRTPPERPAWEVDQPPGEIMDLRLASETSAVSGRRSGRFRARVSLASRRPLGADAVEEHAGGLVGRVLRDQLAAEGLGEVAWSRRSSRRRAAAASATMRLISAKAGLDPPDEILAHVVFRPRNFDCSTSLLSRTPVESDSRRPYFSAPLARAA
jgi:hypothetical protein